MLKHILFDADQTLYPASSLVGTEMVRRINIFTAEFLGITVTEAAYLRLKRDKKYNSTLEWLQESKGLSDAASFFSAIHPSDFENYFPKNPKLVEILSKVTIPCSILTNSWKNHAENILNYLEISPFFSNIFDLIFNNYLGKPNIYAFTNVLDFLELDAKEALFIDDIKQFTDVFYSLGGNVVLVDEKDNYGKTIYEKVRYIEEIEPVLKKYEIIR